MKKRPTKIENRPITSLTLYGKNARVHSAEQIEQIKRSIERFGFTMPILIAEDGEIIAGHGRLTAAVQLGWNEVPCIVAHGWTPEQVRAYRVADNRLSETSQWDLPALQIELAEISEEGWIGIGDLGFEPEALENLMAGTFVPADGNLGATGQVTDEDVAASKRRLETSQRTAGDQDLVDVTCPHCGREFSIDRPAD